MPNFIWNKHPFSFGLSQTLLKSSRVLEFCVVGHVDKLKNATKPTKSDNNENGIWFYGKK